MAFFLKWYAIVCCLMSVVSLIAYGSDKRRAIRDQPRIKERSLHMLDLLGGWVGGLVGRGWFRHKTQKTSFLWKSWAIIALHGGLVATVIMNR